MDYLLGQVRMFYTVLDVFLFDESNKCAALPRGFFLCREGAIYT